MLHDLPTELLLQVIDPLAGPDLAALRLTSRLLNNAARPLYHGSLSLSLTWSTRSGPLLRILSKLDALLTKRPEIAMLVKHLELGGSTVFQRLQIIAKERQQIASPAERIDPVARQLFHETRVEKLQDALATCLARLTNLTSVNATSALIFQRPFWGLNLSRFEHLSELIYECPKQPEHGTLPLPMSPTTWRQLASLPLLKHLVVGGKDYSSEFDWDDDVPELSSLRFLEFADVHMREETLGSILAATPGLTRLFVRLKWQIDPIGGERDPFLDGEKLRVALGANSYRAGWNSQIGLQHPENLEDLLLEVSWFTNSDVDEAYGGGFDCGTLYGSESVDWGVKGSIGSLRHLTSLRWLYVAPPMLFGWNPEIPPNLHNIFPNSIEEVNFASDMYDWIQQPDPYRWHPGSNTGRNLVLGSVGPYLNGQQPRGLHRIHFRLGEIGMNDDELRIRCEATMDSLLAMSRGSGGDVNVSVAWKVPGITDRGFEIKAEREEQRARRIEWN